MENGAGRLRALISRYHYLAVVLFILLAKTLFWTWSLAVAHRFPLSPLKYFHGGHHYGIDPRITEHRVDFLTIWIYSDAEWYLSIAERGYPDTDEMKKAAAAEAAGTGFPYTFARGDPAARFQKYTEWNNDAKYAFFPLYPLSIALFRLFLPLHLAAFVATNAISGLAFLMLYALTFTYFSDQALAFRSLVLLIFYPFSVFYQAYYSEGLFLLLAVLSLYFLKKGRLGLSVLCGVLLTLARPVGLVIAIPLLILAIKQSAPAETRASRRAEKLGRQSKRSLIGPIDWGKCRMVCLVPFGLLPLFLLDYFKTGHWNYFAIAQHRWGFEGSAFLENFLHCVFVAGSNFFRLKFLSDHDCQVDYIAMVVFLALLIWSYRRLPLELWSFGVLLWLVPLLLKDLMSFSRYMSVVFPVFISLARIKRMWVFGILLGCFLAGSLVIDGRMVTWRWVG
jgi:hypothetical protein